jgi:hypothetical protein
MAKIFSSEKFSINGDKIRLASSAAGAFEITDASNSVLMSRASIESDIASIATLESTDISTVNDSVDSLSTLESTDKSSVDSSVASLSTLESTDKSTVDSSVASLSTLESTDKSTVDSSVASLSTLESTDISTVNDSVDSLSTLESNDVSTVNSSIASVVELIGDNDVVAKSADLTANDTSKTIAFGRTFDSAPEVTASMFGGASDPIIGMQISEITTSGCTVQFSDDIPNGNYKVKILASV